uniref:Uncharacterized protein n=1 Tax=Anopheles melas TaxID=34690 RepID=A0A182TEW8_9DIPT
MDAALVFIFAFEHLQQLRVQPAHRLLRRPPTRLLLHIRVPLSQHRFLLAALPPLRFICFTVQRWAIIFHRRQLPILFRERDVLVEVLEDVEETFARHERRRVVAPDAPVVRCVRRQQRLFRAARVTAGAGRGRTAVAADLVRLRVPCQRLAQAVPIPLILRADGRRLDRVVGLLRPAIFDEKNIE